MIGEPAPRGNPEARSVNVRFRSDLSGGVDGDQLTLAFDAVLQVGIEYPDWLNGFEHEPVIRRFGGSVAKASDRRRRERR